MNSIKTLIQSRNVQKNILGLLIGTFGGYLYYRYIGCSGGCAITSNPWMTMIWGGILGYLLFDMIKLKEKQPEASDQSDKA